jgi:WhiB family transcriptional regulator, redox-sensing transcriptional regulator
MRSTIQHQLGRNLGPADHDRADEWQARAACVGEDPELFFAPEGERDRARRVREAEAATICARCDVRAECLLDVLQPTSRAYGDQGYRAGTNERQRRTLREKRTTTPPPIKTGVEAHGSLAGYERHLRLKTTPCQSCRDAKAESSRKSRACAAAAVQAAGLMPGGERHGTVKGYHAHVRAGDDPCSACQRAEAAAARRQRLRDKAKGAA